MKKLCVLICEVDESDETQMREVARYNLQSPVLEEVAPGQMVDE